MSTVINTGWLKDNNGEKFAPKTLISQVITSEGKTYEEEIQSQLNNISDIHTHDFYTLNNIPILKNDSGEIVIVDESNNELMKANTSGITTNTVTANKVYGAVWNDYAEWFEKENVQDKFEVGDICSWNENGVVLATSDDANVIGVVSNTYGHILGGNPLADMEENHKNFVPIGLVGRVKVKVIGEVNRGDLIVSAGSGIGQVNNEASIGHVIGKALESSNEKNVKIITVLIK